MVVIEKNYNGGTFVQNVELFALPGRTERMFGSSLFRMGKFDRLQPRDAFIVMLETV